MGDFGYHVRRYHWKMVDGKRTCPCCLYWFEGRTSVEYIRHVSDNFDAIMTILHAQSLGVKPDAKV